MSKGCSHWGRMSPTIPNKLRIPHPTNWLIPYDKSSHDYCLCGIILTRIFYKNCCCKIAVDVPGDWEKRFEKKVWIEKLAWTSQRSNSSPLWWVRVHKKIKTITDYERAKWEKIFMKYLTIWLGLNWPKPHRPDQLVFCGLYVSASIRIIILM